PNYDLAGTTDLDHDNSPDNVKPTIEEVEYIIKACNKLFPTADYNIDDVKAAFAGVRPLVYQEGDKTGKVSREHTILQDKANKTITIVGGKLTTYRIMSKQALDKAIRHMGVMKGKCVTDKLPLWGGEIKDWSDFYHTKSKELVDEFSISDSTANMLVQWYGSEIDFFKEFLVKYGTKKLHKDQVWLETQIVYACQVELAQTPIDVMRRRMNIMFEQNNGLDLIDKVVAIMAEQLNWDDKTKSDMSDQTKEYIEKYIRVRN
ncbi:MAG: glycerol-3-phosphate dehydrogenase C-terminal domain-containing protein, partial [Candidatus Heimdallarchaeota archaeon]